MASPEETEAVTSCWEERGTFSSADWKVAHAPITNHSPLPLYVIQIKLIGSHTQDMTKGDW